MDGSQDAMVSGVSVLPYNKYDGAHWACLDPGNSEDPEICPKQAN